MVLVVLVVEVELALVMLQMGKLVEQEIVLLLVHLKEILVVLEQQEVRLLME